jgi:hypothetical protein
MKYTISTTRGFFSADTLREIAVWHAETQGVTDFISVVDGPQHLDLDSVDGDIDDLDEIVELLEELIRRETFTQVGTIEIDGIEFGVAENTSRTKTVATLMDRPYEPVYTNASAFTDEERAVARAMEKAGWWHA